MPELPPEEDSPGPMMGPGGTKFVPPHMRGGKSAAQLDLELKRQRDECGIRITNLSEETDVDDLKELCRPFGTVLRAHIATDKASGGAVAGAGPCPVACGQAIAHIHTLAALSRRTRASLGASGSSRSPPSRRPRRPSTSSMGTATTTWCSAWTGPTETCSAPDERGGGAGSGGWLRVWPLLMRPSLFCARRQRGF